MFEESVGHFAMYYLLYVVIVIKIFVRDFRRSIILFK